MKLQIQKEKVFDDYITNLIYLRKSHPSYEVIHENNEKVGIGILLLHFGSSWEFALDRLDNQLDGLLTTIHHQGLKFKVYRKPVSEKCDNYPRLRRVK